MRVWLVDDRGENGVGAVEALLRQLEAKPDSQLRLLGRSLLQADFVEAMRKLVPDLLDVLVINGRVVPEAGSLQEILSLGVGTVLLLPIQHLESFRALASAHPVCFVPATADADGLWLAMVSAMGAMRREALWKVQLAQLQQRLADRITIERAKGILVERLKISEEEAYRRMRMLSRQQRRQIRDIAQSLLDTQLLFAGQDNGLLPFRSDPGVDLPGRLAPPSSAAPPSGEEIS